MSRRKKKNGIYRSGLEAKIALKLSLNKVPFTYEKIKITYQKKTSVYTPDFQLPNNIIVEAKGRFVASDRAKHLLVKEQHPEHDIRFVFERNLTLSKVSKTTYTAWCDKHGFKWAIKEIPESWIKEKKK
jgi:hypothetical protein